MLMVLHRRRQFAALLELYHFQHTAPFSLIEVAHRCARRVTQPRELGHACELLVISSSAWWACRSKCRPGAAAGPTQPALLGVPT